jgi:tetratricopeptide (TPR) repeat protein
VVWPPPGTLSPFAVLELAVPLERNVPRWGVLIGRNSWTRAYAAGKSRRPLEVNNLALTTEGRWEPRKGHTTDPDQDGQDWPAAGAPVLCGPFVIGLLDGVADNHSHAIIPLSRMAEEPDLLGLLEPATIGSVTFEPVELALALRPWRPPDPRLPASLLDPRLAIVPFQDPAGYTERLLGWASATDPLSGLLLVGASGSGKHRVARHVAETLARTGWVVGELNGQPAHGWLDAALQSRLPMFLILDEGRQRPEYLRAIVSELATGISRPIRLLVLAEEAGEWWDELLRSSGHLRAVFHQAPELLPGFVPENQFARQLDLAARSFYRASNLGSPVERPHEPFDEKLDTEFRWRWYDRSHPDSLAMRRLHIAAYAAVLGGTDVHERDPEDLILDFETRAWERASVGLTPEAQQHWRAAITAAIAFGAPSESAATATLQLLPGLASTTAEVRRELVEWIRMLYPPIEPDNYWGTLQPKSLCLRYLVRECSSSQMIDSMLPSVEPHQARRAIAWLVQPSPHLADAAKLADRLYPLVARHPRALVPEMLAVARHAPAALAMLERLLDDDGIALPETVYERIVEGIAAPAGALAELDLMARRHLAAAYQRTLEAGSPRPRAKLASLLSSTAIALSETGRNREAVEAGQLALEHYRELMTSGTNRAASMTPYAECLRLQSCVLARDGNMADAIPMAEMAVQLYRQLSPADSTLMARLADTLELLAECAGEAGDETRALDALREAASVRHTVSTAPDAPPSTVAALVATTTMLAEALWRSGDRTAGLAERVNAVTIADRWRPPDPAERRGVLGGCLESLYPWQHAQGQTRPALTTLERLVQLRRERADEEPGAALDLAKTLLALARQQLAVGDRDSAFVTATDALRYARKVTGREAMVVLGAALHAVGGHLARTEQWDKAAESIQEAVQAYWRADPDRQDFLLDAAGALSNLSAALLMVGRADDALDQAQNAQRLLRDRPQLATLGARALAAALTNEAFALQALGRAPEALAAIEKAVDLQDSARASLPEEQRRSLGLQRELLSEQGEVRLAVQAARRVVAVSRVEVHRADAAYQLAKCLAAAGLLEDAVDAASSALSILDALAAGSSRFLEERSEIWTLLSTLHSDLGNQAESAAAAEQAVALSPLKASDVADKSAVRLADALDAASDSALANAPEESIEYARQALTARRNLAVDGDPEQVALLANALLRLARLHSMTGNNHEARLMGEEGLRESRRLHLLGVEGACELVARALLELYNFQIRSATARPEFELGVRYAAEAVGMYRDLSEQGETVGLQRAAALLELSFGQLHLDEHMAAMLSARDAVNVIDEAGIGGADGWDTLLRALELTGQCLSALGDDDQHREVATRRVTILGDLAAADASYLPDLAVAVRSLAEVPAGPRRERESAAQRAVDLHRRLFEQDSLYAPQLVASLRALASSMPWSRRGARKRLRREAEALAKISQPS